MLDILKLIWYYLFDKWFSGWAGIGKIFVSEEDVQEILIRFKG